jgi:hypothetical protein
MWIWRDTVDQDAFHLGTKFGGKHGIKESFAYWATIYSDGLKDLFGQEIADFLKEQKSPKPFKFDIHQFAIQAALHEERERLAEMARTWQPEWDDDYTQAPEMIAQAILEENE